VIDIKVLSIIHYLIGCLLWIPSAGMAETPSTTTAQEQSGRLTWIERPWNVRYVIYVEAERGWDSTKRASIAQNAKQASREPKRRFFSWEELSEPNHLVKTNAPDLFDNPNLAVLVVSFDQDGMVTSPHSSSKPLRGRINQLQYLGLSDGEGLDDRFYYMAHWFTGMGDTSTHWAPAFCHQDQRPNILNVKSDDYLYGKLFKPYPHTPLFGCREWAYQLYDGERPYIDVTSYELGSKGKLPKGQIREFMGWARVGDDKPIIGKHEGDWYCLHDCPGGDAPGLIPDIKAWARRFGWQPPVPPTRVPTFPDPPAKSGTYPYDPPPHRAPGASLKPKGKRPAQPSEQGNDFPDVPVQAGC